MENYGMYIFIKSSDDNLNKGEYNMRGKIYYNSNIAIWWGKYRHEKREFWNRIFISWYSAHENVSVH